MSFFYIPPYKTLLISLLIGIFVLALNACQTATKPTTTKLPKEYAWFYAYANHKDSLYNQKIDAVIAMYKKQNNIHAQAYMTIAKGDKLDHLFEADSKYIQDARDIYKNHKLLPIHYCKLAYYIGSQYDFVGKPDSSIAWLRKCIRYKTTKPPDVVVGYATGLLAQLHLKKGDLQKAIATQLEALSFYEKIKDQINIATTHISIYNTYTNLNRHKEAHQHLDKGLQIAHAVHDTINIMNAYVNKCLSSIIDKQTTISLVEYADSIDQIMKYWGHKTQNDLFNQHLVQTLKHIELKQWSQADNALEKTKLLYKKQPSVEWEFWINSLQINYQIKSKKEPLSVKKAEQLIRQNIENKNYYRATMLLNALNEHALGEKNYKAAHDYKVQQYALRDSLWNQDLRAQIFEHEKKYQTAKKEKELLRQQNIINNTKRQIASLIAALLFVMLLWGIYIFIRKRKTSEREKKLQETFTKNLLQNSEDERSRIANELHDGINHELLSIKTKLSNNQVVSPKEVVSIIDDVRAISRDLHPVMFSQIGLAASIETLCERIGAENDLFVSNEFDYYDKLDPKKELHIYRIVQEALNNTIKHAKATAIRIVLKSNSKEILLSIQDNGVGFDAKHIQTNTKSFGTQSMLNRAKAIGGKLDIKSNEKGTNILLLLNI